MYLIICIHNIDIYYWYMDISLFDYNLPHELIAQKPAEPRDSSRLLVYKNSQNLIDDTFFNIDTYFKKGDVLVINNSQVRPTRLFGLKKGTGGRVEIFLLKLIDSTENIWTALVKGSRLKEGSVIEFEGSAMNAIIVKKDDQESDIRVKFDQKIESFDEILNRIGNAPVPPYIKCEENERYIREKYQTIYAKEKGSVAVPTAGLHFTNRVFDKLKEKGVEILEVTLHVGLGTFSRVKTQDITKHTLHEEFVAVSTEVVRSIKSAKEDGRRVIAVGTTSTRVLESVIAQRLKDNSCDGYQGPVNIYIYPGYEFSVIDGLITNFHLPKSSLIMLVSAFIGREKTMEIYAHAVTSRYRFFSFGDAMLLFNK